MPAGPDVAVVPVERTEPVRDGTVRVPETEPGANVRRAGEDARAGATVVPARSVLGPAELAVSASLGLTSVRCGARPRVAVLVTGDELVRLGQPLGPGQIRDSNAVALAAHCRRGRGGGAGACATTVTPRSCGTRPRDRAWIVCVSGGVSVGPHDHVKPALAELGVEERFWGVRPSRASPPGSASGRTLVFGLPGNPVSAMVTFHLFARPALRRWPAPIRRRHVPGPG